MTDIEKYKSVAVKIDCYQKAKAMAEEKYMSIGAFIRYLKDKEHSLVLMIYFPMIACPIGGLFSYFN